MRRSPSIVPHVADRDVYLVLDDLGRIGRVWRESDEERTDRRTLVQDLMHGQYANPVRIVAFNTAEGWSRDVSGEIAQELAQRAASGPYDVPDGLADFLHRYSPTGNF